MLSAAWHGYQADVDTALQPFLQEGGEYAVRDIRQKHGAKAAAEVQMSLAYTVNALFYSESPF
jgi:hypothetical protein